MFLGNNQPPWRILFWREKIHPNSGFRPTWHGHQRCQDNTPGPQVGIIGLVGDFRQHQKTMEVVGDGFFKKFVFKKKIPQLPIDLSSRHIWGEPNYCKDVKLEHDMNSIANQHRDFGWPNQRVLPQHPSSRDCWRSLTKYPKVGACEVSGYSSVKDAAENSEFPHF